MDIAREVRNIDDPKLRDQLLSILIKSKKDLAADDNFPHLADLDMSNRPARPRPGVSVAGGAPRRP
jgi:hypothetical protein